MNIRYVGKLLSQAFQDWRVDKAPLLGAALAYYTAFSLAPLVLIAISVAGAFFGREAAQGAIVAQIGSTVGPEAATAIQDILRNAREGPVNAFAQAIGYVALLIGASGVFGQLQEAMNTVWKVKSRRYRGFIAFIRDRFLSFTLVFGTLFLLMVSLVASAAISAFASRLSSSAEPLLHVLDFAVSLCATTLLFGMLFKFLPDAMVSWGDVWLAAGFTSILFLIGKLLLGLYIGKAAVGSSLGAAGSLVAILVWVYYASQILLYGAEVAHLTWLARRPMDNAREVELNPPNS
jgi:membrane protein